MILQTKMDSQEKGEVVRLIAKKNSTSVVWKYFGFAANEDGMPSDSNTPKFVMMAKMVQQQESKL